MTGRISIPALRQWATAKPIQLDEVALENQRTLLALVEAVEAAQIYYDGDGTPGTYTRHKVRQRLADALSRFDFGEET